MEEVPLSNQVKDFKADNLKSKLYLSRERESSKLLDNYLTTDNNINNKPSPSPIIKDHQNIDPHKKSSKKIHFLNSNNYVNVTSPNQKESTIKHQQPTNKTYIKHSNTKYEFKETDENKILALNTEKNQINDADTDFKILKNMKNYSYNPDAFKRNSNHFGSHHVPLIKDINSNAFKFIKKRAETLIMIDKKKEYIMNLTIIDLQNNLTLYYKIVFRFDMLIILFDLTVVTMLYFEHFDYLNKMTISESGKKIRIVCLILSIINCLIIIIKEVFRKKYETMKYLLNYSSHYKFGYNYYLLGAELSLHVIQPYPGLKKHWEMEILGKMITYSINMILFLICMLRLYTLIKTINYWNYYSSDKATRLLKFFNNKYISLFVYKVIIIKNSYFAILFLFIGVLYIFALIFKVLENTDAKDIYEFGNFYNCLWYLVSTMTGTGYGDFYPKSLIGRIIGVLCCIIGIFLLSLVVATLIIMSQFNEEERKVIF